MRYSSSNWAQNTVCWLFCTVIDNFGDIGVSWRLAQALRRQLGWTVYLWIDDLSALRQLVPDTPDSLPCVHEGIQLRTWQEARFADIQAAAKPQLVIETFACTLPENVLQVIRTHHPIWLNWEYLSAEKWAVSTHAMLSLQSDGTQKYFWQMGFVPQSGGLLREMDYETRYERFKLSKSVGGETWRIFAFGYHSDVWQKWCTTWANLSCPVALSVAGEPIIYDLKNSPFALMDDKNFSGSLKIIRQKFVPQTQFDEILWAHQLNIVRGEDSFVRAQYAGAPFFWHIYPQGEQAHWDKLDAFWLQYWRSVSAPNELICAHTKLSYELNGLHTLTDAQRKEYWSILRQQFPNWQQAAQQWRNKLFSQSDAISRLSQWLEQNICSRLK